MLDGEIMGYVQLDRNRGDRVGQYCWMESKWVMSN